MAGWPTSFPSASTAFPFRSFDGGEYPDPVAGCPAAFRSSAISAPMLVSFGPGAAPVSSASVVFGRAGQPAQPVCVVTEGSYVSPGDPGGQSTARAILAENHTVVVFALAPLAGATRYSLHLTPNGRQRIDVSFSTT